MKVTISYLNKFKKTRPQEVASSLGERYGSWDDSMASVINLIPKVPRRDFHKIMYNDKKKLGFTAMSCDPLAHPFAKVCMNE